MTKRDPGAESTVLAAWRGLTLRKEPIVGLNGEMIEYTYLDHPGSVLIVPILEGGSVVMVEQFRHLVGECSLEFPCGGIEAGEDPESAARRELLEETGFEAGELMYLGQFYNSNSVSTELTHVFRATELRAGEPQLPDPEEDGLLARLMPLEEVFAKIREGIVHDGATLAAAQLNAIFESAAE